MTDQQTSGTIPQDFLDILRCPVAVHYQDKGSDPGRLRLVHDGQWLVCDDSGYKYPIVDGIPRMLVDIGEKYKDVAEADLPVPPPAD
ncbi:MAG TPA: Trm112 family protein [Aggregatilineales bacterium]|nr:Trm112 family protein [Aggregatilineales bacterium]